MNIFVLDIGGTSLKIWKPLEPEPTQDRNRRFLYA